MFKDNVIVDFLDKLNSSTPTPGGGAVAALNGAEAAGLVCMVGNVTVNKQLKKETEPDKELVKTVLVASNIQNDFLVIMDEDAKVFDELMACYKLPNINDEQKEARKVAIQNGCKKACQPPKKTVENGLKLLPLVKNAIFRGDKGVISDGYIAGRLIVSAIWGGIYNLMINISSIKDEAFCKSLSHLIDIAKKEMELFNQEVLAVCNL